MKVIISILLFSLLGSCTGHARFSDSEISKLVLACGELLSVSEFGDFEERRWPEPLDQFNPKRIYVRADGSYIVLKTLFVEESGVFCARKQGSYNESGDPSYKMLRDDIYTYQLLS